MAIIVCGSARNKIAYFGINPYPVMETKEETSMKEYVEHINRKQGKKGKGKWLKYGRT